MTTMNQLSASVQEHTTEASRLLNRKEITTDAMRAIAAQLNQANNAAQRLLAVMEVTDYIASKVRK